MLPMPLWDKVLLEEIPEKAEEQVNGLYLPTVQNKRDPVKKFPQGKVVAFGQGLLLASGVLRPLPLKVGDIVAYLHTQAFYTVWEGKPIVLVQECNIGMILKFADGDKDERVSLHNGYKADA